MFLNNIDFRLSTIQHADLILVLKEGEIVEMGSHQTLLSMNGVYAMLSKEQGL
jgi:ATP-binding cassette subfamily B protein